MIPQTVTFISTMTPGSTDSTPVELEAQDAQLRGPGFFAARLERLPRQVLGINTRNIPYGDVKPTSNPELTVWALGNALVKCSGKFLSRIDTTKVSQFLVDVAFLFLTCIACSTTRDPHEKRSLRSRNGAIFNHIQ